MRSAEHYARRKYASDLGERVSNGINLQMSISATTYNNFFEMARAIESLNFNVQLYLQNQSFSFGAAVSFLFLCFNSPYTFLLKFGPK